MMIAPRSRLVAATLMLLFMGSSLRTAHADDTKMLYSTLWAQTSAEYRALCTLVYRSATQAMHERVRLGNYPRDAQGRRFLRTCTPTVATGGSIDQPLAVVMDLDETVLDNSGFEAHLLKTGQTFRPALWKEWVSFQGRDPRARRTVPGALEFIRSMESEGVTVIYLTNRTEHEGGREAVLSLLRALGLGTAGLEERLLMLPATKEVERQASLQLLKRLGLSEASAEGKALLDNQSQKHRRRLEVMLRYQVVGYFGDDLNDFPMTLASRTPAGQPMVDLRKREVDAHAGHWGTDWFILPNPVYGSWEPGRTLPKERAVDLLDDFGFGDFLKKAPR